MDGNDDDLVTPEQLKAEAEKKAAEKAEKAKREYEEAKKKAAEEENKIVTLTPEYDENTEFSGEVLGEVDQFRDEAEIKSYHTIDIDIPEDKAKGKDRNQRKRKRLCRLPFISFRIPKNRLARWLQKFPCIVPMNREIFSMSRQADFPRL